MSLIFVDVEAWGDAPTTGQLTEIGAVDYDSRQTFYAQLVKTMPDPLNPACPLPTRVLTVTEMQPFFTLFANWLKYFKPPYKFVSDNPAYDWQWINCGFHSTLGRNPFGHSARRIGDFYAGLFNDFWVPQDWKKLRITSHTHNPVDDAMGNVEAFEQLLEFARLLKKER